MRLFQPKTAAQIAGVFNGTGGATRATAGDVVVLPPGSFTVDSTPLAGVRIVGAGSGRTTLVGNFYWNGGGDLVNAGALVGLTIDMNGASDVGGNYGSAELRDGVFVLDDVVFANADKNNFTAVARFSARPV